MGLSQALRKTVLVLAMVVLASPPSLAMPVQEAKVVHITDGDTFTLLVDGVRRRAQLAGVDAPEIDQSYGMHARKGLAAMVFNRTVWFREAGRKKDGTIMVHVYVAGRNVNAEMVRLGLAWAEQGTVAGKGMAALERQARTESRGLWAGSAPMPPWQRRRGQPTLR